MCFKNRWSFYFCQSANCAMAVILSVEFELWKYHVTQNPKFCSFLFVLSVEPSESRSGAGSAFYGHFVPRIHLIGCLSLVISTFTTKWNTEHANTHDRPRLCVKFSVCVWLELTCKWIGVAWVIVSSFHESAFCIVFKRDVRFVAHRSIISQQFYVKSLVCFISRVGIFSSHQF